MDEIIGTILWLTFAWTPQGTLEANGQCMPINSNQALYSLLGDRYGGSYQSNNFCLPDLRPKDKDGNPDPNWNNGPRAVIVTQGIYPSRQ
jgi:microcystin-dependent protein